MVRTILFRALCGALVSGACSGCSSNDSPSGPRTIVPPSFTFSPGQAVSYSRANYDRNYNEVASYQHDALVFTAGETIGGLGDAAAGVVVATSGGAGTRLDTAWLAVQGGMVLIYDPKGQTGGRFPRVPLWGVLVDLRLNPAADTLLSSDSTFVLPMASGHVLRDRVTTSVVTRYVREDRIPAFGTPFINCFLFMRTVSCGETVDTGGVILFQGPTVSLLDSVWFGDGLGPVRWTSQGSTFGVDSLGLPFSLSALQAVCTPASFDSYEVHYANVNGRDLLSLRRSLYETPPLLYTVTAAYAKNF